MREVEHTHYYLVGIPTYGFPDKMKEDLRLRLARALHHDVKPGCTVQDAWHEGDALSDDWRVDPHKFTLDAKGDDMGNHGPEHPVPLVPLE